jgi:V/A-type H+-transporting ATPase subunit I
MLRPRPCRWFELITARDGLAPVLETLARTGTVELQTHERHGTPLVIEGAMRPIARFQELAKTYRSHWPPSGPSHAAQVSDPAATLAVRLAQLEAWRAEADPQIAALERLLGQSRTLADVARLLQANPAALPQPELLSRAGRFMLAARVYVVAAHSPSFELPADTLTLTVPLPGGKADESFVVLVGRREAMPAVDDHYLALKARRIAWPADLGGSVAQAAQEVAQQRDALERQRKLIESQLAALAARHDLADALADIELVEWLIQHGAELATSERLVWITGWTTAADVKALCAPLQAQGLRCVAQFPAPPQGAEPPSVLSNPPWVRAFESLPRMLGQPGRDEADPSLLVALVAPLLFGFMFGDVGHGAVFCLAGWQLRRRAPMLVLLVPGGAMAIVFGLLFGTVFAREDVIPALWMHPLHDPVRLLAAAVALGAAILLCGLLLNALQAGWRREARLWWARDAGLLLAYMAVLAAVVQRGALWVSAAGALWFALGSMFHAGGRRLAALAGGMAQFVEQALQLFVNTVSFARVGAFALAHAGLSLAVVGVAEASGGVGYWIVLLLGNLLILMLEGLVVGIQTTRLLLFEFFVRFLKGSGRAFRPLPVPYVQSTS